MPITIALAGNPNSGKTTLFNALTGSNQYVGNWPGVTVEKKEGKLKADKSITLTDLPGIYSLSPYSLEEVIARDYLKGEKGASPDLIINLVDATNLERSLYLTTQLAELNIPMVIALNFIDQVDKRGIEIDAKALKDILGYPVVEISALHNKGVNELIQAAKKSVQMPKRTHYIAQFDEKTEEVLGKIIKAVPKLDNSPLARWNAIKLLEDDGKTADSLSLSEKEYHTVEALADALKEYHGDDGEGIISNARYNYIETVVQNYVKTTTADTISAKVDRIVTNRILAIPIFILVMTAIYYIAIKLVGTPLSDWVNDVFVAEWVQGNVQAFLEANSVAPWLTSLICDGIIAGVGAPLGFLPQIVTLFILLTILEDIGYMARIAFILDRILRKFGLSGKSFIPILVGTGCAVPGIMGTRTIENEADRRMTIMVAHYLPCSAKSAIVSLFASTVLGYWWFAPLCYFMGIVAVVITGLILKRFPAFASDPTPFIMELPEYHVPRISSVLLTTWDRTKAFLIKAGTIILLVVVILWFLQNITVAGEFAPFGESDVDSLLSAFGKLVSPLFIPLGFDNWVASVATFTGIAAKEVVVSTMGMFSGISGGDADANALSMVPLIFTPASAFAFMMFNQFNVPCQACIGAYRSELVDKKWIAFAVTFQMIFAYALSFIIYQFAHVAFEGGQINAMTIIAAGVFVLMLYLMFRKPSTKARSLESQYKSSVAHAEMHKD